MLHSKTWLRPSDRRRSGSLDTEPTNAKGTDERPRLLLIGHGEPVESDLRLALDRHGFAVEPSSLASALSSVRKRASDLALLVGDAARDSGRAVLRAFARDATASVVPVVVLVGEGGLDAKSLAFRLGGVAAVPRAASGDEIARQIANLSRDLRAREGSTVELGEATFDELVERITGKLRSGILSVGRQGGEPVRIVLGAGRAVAGVLREFVDRVRPLGSPAERLTYELLEDIGGGPIGLLDAETEPGDLSLWRGLRVLVVGQESGRAEALARELGACGATVAVSDLAGRGLERARDLDPEVVVIDAAGIEGPGFEVMRQLRRDLRLRWATTLVVPWDGRWPDPRGARVPGRLAQRMAPLVVHARGLRDRANEGEAFDVRLESTGPFRLLRVLAEVRGPLHLSVHGAMATVEIDLSEGLVTGASATGSPGASFEGIRALAALLSMGTARVHVEPRASPGTANLGEPVEEALARAVREQMSLGPGSPSVSAALSSGSEGARIHVVSVRAAREPKPGEEGAEVPQGVVSSTGPAAGPPRAKLPEAAASPARRKTLLLGAPQGGPPEHLPSRGNRAEGAAGDSTATAPTAQGSPSPDRRGEASHANIVGSRSGESVRNTSISTDAKPPSDNKVGTPGNAPELAHRDSGRPDFSEQGSPQVVDSTADPTGSSAGDAGREGIGPRKPPPPPAPVPRLKRTLIATASDLRTESAGRETDGTSAPTRSTPAPVPALPPVAGPPPAPRAVRPVDVRAAPSAQPGPSAVAPASGWSRLPRIVGYVLLTLATLTFAAVVGRIVVRQTGCAPTGSRSLSARLEEGGASEGPGGSLEEGSSADARGTEPQAGEVAREAGEVGREPGEGDREAGEVAAAVGGLGTGEASGNRTEDEGEARDRLGASLIEGRNETPAGPGGGKAPSVQGGGVGVTASAASGQAAERTAGNELRGSDTSPQATTGTERRAGGAGADTGNEDLAGPGGEGSAASEADAYVERANDAPPRIAEDLYRRALEIDPRHHHAMVGLARLLLARGAASEALPYAEAAVQRRPRRAAYRVLLGDIRQAAGDSSGAREAWEQALALDPTNRDARARLGL